MSDIVPVTPSMDPVVARDYIVDEWIGATRDTAQGVLRGLRLTIFVADFKASGNWRLQMDEDGATFSNWEAYWRYVEQVAKERLEMNDGHPPLDLPSLSTMWQNLRQLSRARAIGLEDEVIACNPRAVNAILSLGNFTRGENAEFLGLPPGVREALEERYVHGETEADVLRNFAQQQLGSDENTMAIVNRVASIKKRAAGEQREPDIGVTFYWDKDRWRVRFWVQRYDDENVEMTPELYRDTDRWPIYLLDYLQKQGFRVEL